MPRLTYACIHAERVCGQRGGEDIEGGKHSGHAFGQGGRVYNELVGLHGQVRPEPILTSN